MWRHPPKLLGGYDLGDTVHYIGPSFTYDNGQRVEYGQRGEVIGPGGPGEFGQLLAVLESDSPTGPFQFVSNKTGSDDPFGTLALGNQNVLQPSCHPRTRTRCCPAPGRGRPHF